MKRLLPHLAVFLVVAGAYLSGALAPVENAFTDLRFGLADRSAGGDLVIVEIDARSLRELDVWPWPRIYHAAVIDRLVESGAADIALDIDFSSRSTPAGDAALAEALERAGGRVILPIFRQRASAAPDIDGESRTMPVPELRASTRLALVNVSPGADGLIRRHIVSEVWGDGRVPTMSAMLANLFDAPAGVYHIDFGIRPDTIPRLSYVDVLNGEFDRATVAGRKIIIGATAVELGDQFSVPVYRALAGPVLQAMAYESLVQGRSLGQTAPLPVLVAALALALLIGPWFATWRWSRGLLVVIGGGLALAAGAFAAQDRFALLVDVIPLGATLVLCFGVGLVGRINQQTLRIVVQEMSLRRTNARMRSVVESSMDGIITFTGDGVVETVNPAAGRIFGALPEEIAGQPLARLLPALARHRGSPGEYFLDGHGPAEVTGRRADGTSFPLEVAVSSMEGDGVPVFVGILRDITERKQQREQLEFLALHDTLTGLPNRKFLDDQLKSALTAAETSDDELALLLLDLDGFKEINDTLGHPVGDTLLVEVGRRVCETVGERGMVARLGGDEFGVLVGALRNASDARIMAQRITKAVEEPYRIDGLSLQVTASVGIALCPEHGVYASKLLRAADIAMYAAKRDHTRVAIYDSSSDRHSVRNLAMSGDLRQAIEGSQLSLHFQPQIDIESGAITGAEALVRWRHPQHGFIMPGEFVPMAEQTGLIRRLNDWIIRRAIRQSAEWHHQGLDIAVSINLSARNLHEEKLPDTLIGIFDAYGVDPGCITFEITESAIMIDPDRAMRVIQRISAIGVRLSIDDFGTGYSSLSYLKRLPVDEIKIDKSFVINMTEDASDAVIVRSTIDLAHNLGLKVVAEGIETEESLARLAALRCDVGQGFLLGRPAPAAELERLIRAPSGTPDRIATPALRVVAE